MPTAEVLDWGPSSGLEGLQDSLGSCRGPENSLFTAHRKSGSWSSAQGSCSEESHCLWTARRNKNQNQNEQLEETSVTACSQFDYFITSDECNCQTGGGKKLARRCAEMKRSTKTWTNHTAIYRTGFPGYDS